ncbi:MAG: AGE family epimerase/isomerase [Clostridia bacterium]|nr:AGE family epimerase/isomerase [Clostridia bacterium]
MTKYGKYLTEKSLAHYLKIQSDEELGGIFTCFNPDGSVAKEEKHIWFLGRSMWSYAMTYMHIEKKQEYLDMCERIFRFLSKIEFVDGRFPLWVTRDGKLYGSIRGVYNEGFVAIGLAQYYRICKKEEVKVLAEKLFDVMYDGYFSLLDKRQNNPAEPVPTQVYGFNMAMLKNAQFVRNAGIRVDEANKLASTCVERMKMHVDDELKMVLEHCPLPGYEVTPEMAHTCPGHVMEGAWFVLCEAEYRGDKEMALFGKKLVDYSMPEGFEKMARLIPTSMPPSAPYNFGRSTTILAWPQQEAVITYSLAYQMFGDEKYKRLAKLIEDAAEEYFCDPDDDRWYLNIQISDPPARERKEKGPHTEGPFHFERMLIAMDILLTDGNIKRYIS